VKNSRRKVSCGQTLDFRISDPDHFVDQARKKFDNRFFIVTESNFPKSLYQRFFLESLGNRMVYIRHFWIPITKIGFVSIGSDDYSRKLHLSKKFVNCRFSCRMSRIISRITQGKDQ
jgi:hypothetical protein